MIRIPFPVNGILYAVAALYAKAVESSFPAAFAGAVVDCAKSGSML
jgi:hypothetical protein